MTQTSPTPDPFPREVNTNTPESGQEERNLREPETWEESAQAESSLQEGI